LNRAVGRAYIRETVPAPSYLLVAVVVTQSHRRTCQVRFLENNTTPGAPGGTNATTGAHFSITFGVKARL
jgi:hypothetical protein